jgi:hypothetical protein
MKSSSASICLLVALPQTLPVVTGNTTSQTLPVVTGTTSQTLPVSTSNIQCDRLSARNATPQSVPVSTSNIQSDPHSFVNATSQAVPVSGGNPSSQTLSVVGGNTGNNRGSEGDNFLTEELLLEFAETMNGVWRSKYPDRM